MTPPSEIHPPSDTPDLSPQATEAEPGPNGVLRFLQDWSARTAGSPVLTNRSLGLIAGFLFFSWVLSGIYKVQPDEQGVILRFGEWVSTTDPGLHYHLPYPIDSALFPKVTQVNQMLLGRTENTDPGSPKTNSGNQMLTGDENIVEADCAVFWKIQDAGRFLFKANDPPNILRVAAESALREVVGRNPIQSALSDKRQMIADEVKELLQHLLDSEDSGIQVTQVQLQRVDPPSAVIDAFNDVQRARADQERARNEAEAFRNDILPRARGEAQRIAQEAEAYHSQVVNLAEGDAKGFLSVYASYAAAKDVTAWRLYMDSVDELLKKAGKVIIDSSGKGTSGIMPYLPLSDRKEPLPASNQNSQGARP